MTSQIFANIYLNEFDRFVRHKLKPQAYIRYGDDFVLFAPSRRQAHVFRRQAVEFLRAELQLTINPKNDIVVASKAGLKFLGHTVDAQSVLVDRHTTKSVLARVNERNIASYRSLNLSPEARQSLDWILLEDMLT